MNKLKIISPEGQSWCKTCKAHKSVSSFCRGSRYNGLSARCRSCANAGFNKWKEKNREKVKLYQKSWQQRQSSKDKKSEYARQLKAEIIFKYGGKCACCGESGFEFLSIDHIDGSGGVHRSQINASGTGFYRWLKKMEFPKSNFQILCMNCNFAKGKYNECPHKRAMLVAI